MRLSWAIQVKLELTIVNWNNNIQEEFLSSFMRERTRRRLTRRRKRKFLLNVILKNQVHLLWRLKSKAPPNHCSGRVMEAKMMRQKFLQWEISKPRWIFISHLTRFQRERKLAEKNLLTETYIKVRLPLSQKFDQLYINIIYKYYIYKW